MAQRESEGSAARTADWERREAKSSRGEAAFRTHLTTYLVVGLFLLTLNLLTSPGELWFYWPLFFWGWALVFQAVATYGAEAPWQALAVVRSIVPGLGTRAQPKGTPGEGDPAGAGTWGRAARRAPHSAPFAAAAFASVHERIEGLKEIALQIPAGPVREQAFRICAAADRIAEAMAADRTDAKTVTWFNERLLEPAERLLAGYVRLAGRGVAGAGETLRRVEEQNLPLIESRLDALYDQLHRGEIVDLAVASEMLDIELLDSPPVSGTGRN
ncbi:MAG: 2TM domain-containing protein [Chloroflexi bacterium]|nr:2TM domain-containing protein [Chloroflexota bacterium]